MGGYFGPDRTGNVAGKTLHIHFYLNDGDGDYNGDYESKFNCYVAGKDCHIYPRR